MSEELSARRIKRPGKPRRYLNKTRLFIGTLIVAAFATGGVAGMIGTANADLPSAWVQTIDIPDDGSSNGILINGPTTGLVNMIEFKDGLDNPIFAIGNDGGPKVFGDDFGVYGSRGGVFLPEVYMTPDQITIGTSCPLDNTVAISGWDGGFYRCHASTDKWVRIL